MLCLPTPPPYTHTHSFPFLRLVPLTEIPSCEPGGARLHAAFPAVRGGMGSGGGSSALPVLSLRPFALRASPKSLPPSVTALLPTPDPPGRITLPQEEQGSRDEGGKCCWLQPPLSLLEGGSSPGVAGMGWERDGESRGLPGVTDRAVAELGMSCVPQGCRKM